MNNRIIRLAKRIVEAFPELSDKENNVAGLINSHIKSELKNLDKEIDRLLFRSDLGDSQAMLKLIKIFLCTDKEPEKSEDFPSDI